jgi:hypothetical protein
MEAQAHWAGKLLQDFQKRMEAPGFPGPQTEGPTPGKDSPARTAQGIAAWHYFVTLLTTTTVKTRDIFILEESDFAQK